MSKTVRQVSLALARATTTSLAFWLDMPVAEWAEWIEAAQEQQEGVKNR